MKDLGIIVLHTLSHNHTFLFLIQYFSIKCHLLLVEQIRSYPTKRAVAAGAGASLGGP